jgi:hypothetical protein
VISTAFGIHEQRLGFTGFEIKKLSLYWDSPFNIHILERLATSERKSNPRYRCSILHNESLSCIRLCVFDAMKTLKQMTSNEFENDSVNNHITRLIHIYEQTATSFPIHSLFKRVVLISDRSTKPYKQIVNAGKPPRKSRFFRDWESEDQQSLAFQAAIVASIRSNQWQFPRPAESTINRN